MHQLSGYCEAPKLGEVEEEDLVANSGQFDMEVSSACKHAAFRGG
jgi:hypothetical protein